MNTSRCHRHSCLLAALVGLALGCQALGGPSREKDRSKSTAAARAALSTPKPPEPAPAAEATTAEASVEPEAPAPCAATEFNYPAVKAACAEGGRSAVKNIMRGAIAKAKSAGTELKCSNCHLDQKNFGLRPNAVDDLKQWL